MGLLGWAKRQAVQHEARKYDTPEEAQAAIRPYVEAWHMGPKVQAALVAALGAALAGAAQALSTSADPLSPVGMKQALTAAIVGALIALAALFRPVPVDPSKQGDALVAQVARAASEGQLEEHHVDAIRSAVKLPPGGAR